METRYKKGDTVKIIYRFLSDGSREYVDSRIWVVSGYTTRGNVMLHDGNGLRKKVQPSSLEHA